MFDAVLRRLETLSETDPVRWHDLLWFVLSWALRRRPGSEREALIQTARESQTETTHREEIRRMSETIEQTWEQELVARGEARGEARGQLRTARESLRVLLEARFGPLSQELLRQIEAIDDLDRLRQLFRQALDVASLERMRLE